MSSDFGEKNSTFQEYIDCLKDAVFLMATFGSGRNWILGWNYTLPDVFQHLVRIAVPGIEFQPRIQFFESSKMAMHSIPYEKQGKWPQMCRIGEKILFCPPNFCPSLMSRSSPSPLKETILKRIPLPNSNFLDSARNIASWG
ncbi:uncharacterized protein G2W53_035313 [Senna tora]|uniref:Uncharacterized protein n=1 Tax=Senna tora TaxID=362788 RepID=A0A834SQ61_9FABA|nr:uncharacterized protein G2W53_035313 [Senna tora]